MQRDATALNELLSQDPALGPLAFRESSGWADARRPADNKGREFVGLFQFGPDRLEDARRRGIVPPETTLDDLASDGEIQARVAQWHFENHRQTLAGDRYAQFVGQEIDGIPVTQTGMLYAAHLAGLGGLSAFLNGSGDRGDQLGTRVSDYLALGAAVEAGNADVPTVQQAAFRPPRTETAEAPSAQPPAASDERVVAAPSAQPPAAPDERVVAAAGQRHGVQPASDSLNPFPESARRSEDGSQRVTAPGEIYGSDTNPLLPLLRERGMNQATNFPLSRALREGYDSTEIVDALQRRQGMDPRWPAYVSEARRRGFSDDQILAAMVGANDSHFLAAVEGLGRGASFAAGAWGGAVLAGKGALASPVAANPFAVAAIAAVGGLVGGLATYQVGRALVEPTTFSPAARITHNAAETAASIVATIPAFRQLANTGAKAMREAQIEAARASAARAGTPFNPNIVEFGRTQRFIDAVARNVGAAGSGQRRVWTAIESASAIAAGGGAALAQATFPENPWARVAMEVGGGFATAPAAALAGSFLDGVRKVVYPLRPEGASRSAARVFIAEHMVQQGAFVTPRLFRDGLTKQQQAAVIAQINRTLPDDAQIPGAAAFLRYSEEAQENILRSTSGNGKWAFRTAITTDNLANMPPGVRAEALEATGLSLLDDIQTLAATARRVGVLNDASTQQFLPESLMRMARGIAARDMTFADALDRQKQQIVDDLTDVLRLHFSAIGPSGDPQALQRLAQNVEELFGQIHQDSMQHINRRLGQVVADGLDSPDTLAERFNAAMTAAYTNLRNEARAVAKMLYDEVPNNPIEAPGFLEAARTAPTVARPTTSPKYDADVGRAANTADLIGAWQRLLDNLTDPEDVALVTKAMAASRPPHSELAAAAKQLETVLGTGGPGMLGARDLHRLRVLLERQKQRTLDAAGHGDIDTPYYAQIISGINRDLDNAGPATAALMTANAYYKSFRTAFGEGLGDTLAKYLNPYDPRLRNPDELLRAMLPNNGSGVSARWGAFNDMLTFLQREAQRLGLDLGDEFAGVTEAAKRESMYRVSAQVLLERVVNESAKGMGKKVTLQDINLDAFEKLRRDFQPLLDVMPSDLRSIFLDPSDALPLLNKAQGMLGDLQVGNQPLSLAFGTESPQFEAFLGLLSSRGGLLKRPDGVPLAYSEQTGAQFMHWLTTPTDFLPNRVPLMRDTAQLVRRLADEADAPGGIRQQVLDRLLADPKFAEFKQFLQLPQTFSALDGLTGQQLRDGFIRAFGEFGLHYNHQTAPFSELARRVLLPVGADPQVATTLRSLREGPAGKRSHADSIVAILEEANLLTRAQREGIEEYLHFAADYERALMSSKGPDAKGFLAESMEVQGMVDVYLRTAGSAIGGMAARLLGDPSSLIARSAGSRAVMRAFNKVPLAHAQKTMKELLLNGGMEEALSAYVRSIDNVGDLGRVSSWAERLAATFFTPRVTNSVLRAFRDLDLTADDTPRAAQPPAQPSAPPARMAGALPPPPPPPSLSPAQPSQPRPVNFQGRFPDLFQQQQQQQQQGGVGGGQTNGNAASVLFPNDPLLQSGIAATPQAQGRGL